MLGPPEMPSLLSQAVVVVVECLFSPKVLNCSNLNMCRCVKCFWIHPHFCRRVGAVRFVASCPAAVLTVGAFTKRILQFTIWRVIETSLWFRSRPWTGRGTLNICFDWPIDGLINNTCHSSHGWRLHSERGAFMLCMLHWIHVSWIAWLKRVM